MTSEIHLDVLDNVNEFFYRPGLGYTALLDNINQTDYIKTFLSITPNLIDNTLYSFMYQSGPFDRENLAHYMISVKIPSKAKDVIYSNQDLTGFE